MQIESIQLLKNNEHVPHFQTTYVNYKCPTLNMNHKYVKSVLLTCKVDIFDVLIFKTEKHHSGWAMSSH